jgi:hypothetical protein
VTGRSGGRADARCSHAPLSAKLRYARPLRSARALANRRSIDSRGPYDQRLPISAVRADEHPASTAITAIRTGDVEALGRLVAEHPELAAARIARSRGRTMTLVHVVTDWPGHVPNGAASVAQLIAAGAEVDARSAGDNRQTPLHWAASSGDVEVIDALLDAGADIEAPGAFDGAGGPLDNAVAFGQWPAARRLVERGARTNLWHAGALGLLGRLEEQFTDAPAPAPAAVTEAFWQACHGGQLPAARYLLERGADLGWIGYDDSTALDVARRSHENAGAPTRDPERLAELVAWLLAQGARPAARASPGDRERDP